jgi:hypothetical protein
VKGLLAGFDSEQGLRLALERLKAAGHSNLETYTPRPLSDDEPAGAQAASSPLPLLMFIAGMVGFAGFFLLMAYADTVAYPLDIGGRPNFAWPAFVPIAFELGVLCAMVTGFVGYFVICRMPHLYDPVDACDEFREASRDGWFVAVRARESEPIRIARDLLSALDTKSLEEFSP